jgi:SAM-dependent methyltransferase
MNASINDPIHPSIVYYDSDYPSKYFPVYPENLDETVQQQGIADDVEKYVALTTLYGKNVLEVCCGTGRIAMPLAMQGCQVTAIDMSPAMLKRFKNKITAIADFPSEKLNVLKKDVTNFSLPETNFDVAICAFNSLLCIPDFYQQQEAIKKIAAHVRPNGLFALDIWNPLIVNLRGDDIPEYYFTRRRTDNGNQYKRYAATGPMNINQVQQVYGWYDETLPNGSVTKSTYSMEWRIIFRYELELMLNKAGFIIKNIYGGNNNEPLQTNSMKMFVEAVKQ